MLHSTVRTIGQPSLARNRRWIAAMVPEAQGAGSPSGGGGGVDSPRTGSASMPPPRLPSSPIRLRLPNSELSPTGVPSQVGMPPTVGVPSPVSVPSPTAALSLAASPGARSREVMVIVNEYWRDEGRAEEKVVYTRTYVRTEPARKEV